MRVQTHDGLFHADEVFAIALLKIIFKDIQVIRSRNFNHENIDLYIDIGNGFDSIKYFDHHFKEFDEYHDNNRQLPKAAFGLIYDKFINQLITDERAINKIRVQLVIPIDAHDNNVKFNRIKDVLYIPYSTSNIISSFNNKDIRNNDNNFNTAVEFAITILNNLIENTIETLKGEDKVVEFFNQINSNTNYIIFDKYYNYSNVIRDPKYNHIKHVIFPEANQYRAICIKDPQTQNNKCPFPEEWSGLSNTDLEKVTNIPGSVFVHRGRFLAINKTLDGIIKMVETCYKNN
jgi:uncharacterized UPF0160 family protein